MEEAEMDLEPADTAHRVSEVLPSVIAAFRELDMAGRRTLLRTISALFEADNMGGSYRNDIPEEATPHGDRFSRERDLTPKEFLLKKQPQTDVERVACLAYFLSEYLGQKHFKTLDISKLNTDAAQTKFSNAAMAVENATKSGYLVAAVKGNKQMSAAGELFVEGLPDREAARGAMAAAQPRRRGKKVIRPATKLRTL